MPSRHVTNVPPRRCPLALLALALLPLVLGCQAVSAPAPATVTSAAAAPLVPVAPNTAGTTQTPASFGSSTIETLAYGNPYRIRTSGTISALQFSFHTGSSATHLYVRFWTQTASNINSFRLNCTTEDLLTRSLTAGLNTVVLASPCAVTAGDFWSVYAVNPSSATASAAPLDTLTDTYTFSFSDTSAFASIGSSAHVFASSISFDAPIPAILNLFENAAPTLAVAGDSQLDGWNGLGTGMADFWEKYLPSNSAFPNFVATVPANQMPLYVAQARHWTLADYAEAGAVSARIATVFTTIVVPLHPRVAIVGFTNNDTIQNLWNAQTYLANYTAIASAAQAAGIKLILTATPSIGYDSDTVAAELDLANSYGPTLCAVYACTWIDTRPTVDLPRPGGPSGNLWDMNPAFYFGDDLHLNAAGQQAIANLVLNSLSSYQP